MGELLNLEELAVFLSVCGAAGWWFALGARRNPPWGESAVLKRLLLGLGGALFQVPVVLVLVHEPPYATGGYAVEPFDLGRVLVEYAVVVGIFASVALLVRWMA